MPRYIDADALKADLDAWTRIIQNPAHYAREDALHIIDSTPTADVVPVVRGEWIVDECDATDDVPSFSWIDFHCSECGADYGLEQGQYGWCHGERIPYNYCPNCGADNRESEVKE